MIFENGEYYHIFNQGNNRMPIFYSRENYLFFLDKISKHILPYADVIAWCLMPNHFHLMLYVRGIGSTRKTTSIISVDTLIGSATKTSSVSSSNTPNNDLNKSIGILLASYTRAINQQEKRTGSLFRVHTHAECLTKCYGITPSFINTPTGMRIIQRVPEEEYPQVCFNYIHLNPVKAGLVKKPQAWEFSSYADYCGERNGKLINRKRAEEFGLSITDNPY